MKTRTIKSDILLLLTAIIWGFAFVAQRVGMDHIGPFMFNGIRFALGFFSLIPLVLFTENIARKKKKARTDNRQDNKQDVKILFIGGILAGLALFTGASMQQIGLVYTTAGNAGFITGLYVVIVPILGLFTKSRPDAGTWIGAVLAAIGLYLLSVTDNFTIAFGDLLELIGAFFWAGHVIIIGIFSPRVNVLKLALIQFATCSILSLLTGLAVETTTMSGLSNALVPILYGGIGSVGIAYTLQVVAQKHAHPTHAAIILSLEALFAAVGGWLFLNEILSMRGMLGCALMLTGMLVSQLHEYFLYTRKISGKISSDKTIETESNP